MKHLETHWAQAVALLCIFTLAVAMRLPWLWSTGYAGDVEMYRRWGAHVASHGLSNAYLTQDVTHGPVWLIAVGFPTWCWQILHRATPAGSAPLWVIKLPLIAADVLTAWVLYRFARRTRSGATSIAFAALYALNPVVAFDSAWWGQTDGLAALFAVIAVTSFASRHFVFGGASTTAAVLTKLQAVYLLPIAALEALAPYDRRRLVRTALGGAVAALLLLSPLLIAGTLPTFIARYLGLVGRHPLIHVGAFNVWWLVHGWDGYFLHDDAQIAGGPTYRQVGLGMLALYGLWVFVVSWRNRPRVANPALPAACLALGFYMFSTQMHTRYDFPVLPLLLVVSIVNAERLAAYAALSATFALNQAFFIAQTTGPSFEIIPPPAPLATLDSLGLGPTTAALVNLGLLLVLSWWHFRSANAGQLASGIGAATTPSVAPA
jgi:dolichyl-phosphate-mannose-protein mannosyltransferase